MRTSPLAALRQANFSMRRNRARYTCRLHRAFAWVCGLLRPAHFREVEPSIDDRFRADSSKIKDSRNDFRLAMGNPPGCWPAGMSHGKPTEKTLYTKISGYFHRVDNFCD